MMQRVSDIIQAQDIEQWKQGDKILIRAGTGRGKTYFVKNVLSTYADCNNKKILFLSNRKSLQEQTRSEVLHSNNQWVIECSTYQKFEQDILKDSVDLTQFKYIVCDEAHYFFMDSTFNHMTNLSANYIKDCTDDKVVILMTATPRRIKSYFNIGEERLYELDSEYEYIAEIYKYSKFETIIKRLNTLPKDEKAIFFTTAKKAYTASMQLYDACFICSNANARKRLSNREELHNIQANSRFNSRVLCTTNVLDNGVNIIDSQVKHIVVDMMDVDTVIQCIGRKRIQIPDDRVTLYVADKGYHSIQTCYNRVCKDLEQAIYLRDYGEAAFRKQFRKQEYNKQLIDIDVDAIKINDVAAWKYSELKSEYGSMLKTQHGWIKGLLREMGLEHKSVYSLEQSLDSVTLKQYLDGMVNQKIFAEEREHMKAVILEKMVGKLKKNQKKLGIKSINAMLADLGIPYAFESHKETKGERRNQQYWILKPIGESAPKRSNHIIL
nr:DEAD/DEAH box helicase family protein [uncultured Cellulosilyticum sp.]